MLSWVVLRPFIPYISIVIVILTVGIVIHERAFSLGVKRVTEVYEEAMREERERLQNANSIALEAARQVEKKLRDQLRVRNEEIERILSDGLSDPNANNRALGPDSVSRINRIR